MTTELTTKTTTQTVAKSAEPSKRWLERHEIVDVLLGRAINNNNGLKTIKPTSLISSGSTASTDKHKLKRPSAVEHTSSAGSGVDAGTITAPGTLSPSFILNSTASLNTAAGPSAVSNSKTGIGKFLDSTSTTARASITSGTGLQSGSTGIINALRNITAAANITASPARLSNTTAPVPFMNITNTSPPKLNNTTLTPFLNSTRILPLINGTNTTTPNGLFNGWFLQISGTGVLFTPSSSLASLFTFSSSPSSNSSTAQQHQHLCSIPLSNNDGAPIPTPADNSTAATSALVAIAESRPDSPGSAVYFVEPRVLEDMDNDRQGWYAPLECDPSGASERSNTISTLSCAQGDKEYWVGCGLGLDITSDGDGTAVIDGWNCTGVGLTIEYTDS
ncbi:hypothetical protein K445DRAFT_378474 [Daldinia sp. EC12]|nr:hypothetical protein K445DRAFT_378474 [Daldinia sp. EC12]